jgi:hypothetical protein
MVDAFTIHYRASEDIRANENSLRKLIPQCPRNELYVLNGTFFDTYEVESAELT